MKIKYDKLIRDRMGDLIIKNGQKPSIHIADDKEYWEKLKKKLTEEVDEFLADSSEGQIIDVFEVIDSICKFKEFDKKSIVKMQKQKIKKVGGFDRKVILDEVED